MSQKYQVTVSETRIVTTTYLVKADSREEAETKALNHDYIAVGSPQGLGTPMERAITEVSEMPADGVELKRISNALHKPHAFTVHARIWDGERLGAEQEYVVFAVDVHGHTPSLDIAEMSDRENRRTVPASMVFGLRIESESDDVSYMIQDIVYDTDGETAILDLPEELEIDISPEVSESELEEVLGEAISDRTGWCVKSFTYEKV